MDANEPWEKLRDRHYEMGGQTVQSDGQCVILLKMLPPDAPATMVMALQECTEFDALKKKLAKQIDWFVGHPVSPLPLRKRSWT